MPTPLRARPSSSTLVRAWAPTSAESKPNSSLPDICSSQPWSACAKPWLRSNCCCSSVSPGALAGTCGTVWQPTSARASTAAAPAPHIRIQLRRFNMSSSCDSFGLAHGLGLVHGLVCMAHQRLHALAMLGKKGDARADRRLQHHAFADHQWLAHGSLYLVPHHLRIAAPAHGIEQDGEFVATQRSEEHTSELQSHSDLVCRLLLAKKKIGRSRTLAGTLSGRTVDTPPAPDRPRAAGKQAKPAREPPGLRQQPAAERSPLRIQGSRL